MPKIIFTSRYIQNPSKANAGKLVKYMGTREGVEKLPNGVDNKPATKKQKDLIATCITAVQEAWDYSERQYYSAHMTKDAATEFLDAFIERNADRIDGIKKLVSYMGERPASRNSASTDCSRRPMTKSTWTLWQRKYLITKVSSGRMLSVCTGRTRNGLDTTMQRLGKNLSAEMLCKLPRRIKR